MEVRYFTRTERIRAAAERCAGIARGADDAHQAIVGLESAIREAIESELEIECQDCEEEKD